VPWLETAERAARAAGQAIMAHYLGQHEIKVKGLRDIATEADLAAEAAALKVIRAECPQGLIVSEESNGEFLDHSGQVTWFVDPLDGTTNYARGLPSFCVSVAAVLDGQPIAGVVYDPLDDQLFKAERGQGAYLDGVRLHVSEHTALNGSVILVDWPRDQALRQQAAQFLTRVAPQVDTVRSFGAAAKAFCYVAAGWADAYYQFTLSPWDVAAGILMVEEAGGKVTDLKGQPYALQQKSWLASNGRLHSQITDKDPYG